jgi:hypothetical protein
MTKEKYTFTIESDVMKEFKKYCIEIDRKFSNQVEILLDHWSSSQKMSKEFHKKRDKEMKCTKKSYD